MCSEGPIPTAEDLASHLEDSTSPAHAVVKADDPDLRGKTFSGSMRGTNLSGRDLTLADFSEACDLSEGLFAGANLAGAKFPAGLTLFDGAIKSATELCATASKLTISLLLTTAFVLLTIAGSKDQDLYLGGTAKLPVVDVEVSTSTFYLVAPILMLVIYLALQMSLAKLWQTVTSMPEILPNGVRRESVTLPWLLSDYIPNSRALRSSASRFRSGVFSALLWWVPPAMFIPIWWKYLHHRDPKISSIHGLVLVAAIGLAIAFSSRILTLQPVGSEGKDQSGNRQIWKLVRWCAISAAVFAMVTGAALLPAHLPPTTPSYLNRLDDWLGPFFGSETSPHIERTDISRRLPGWSSASPAESVVSGDLSDKDLSRAVFTDVFAAGSVFDNSNLSEAKMDRVDLEHASFSGAILYKTHFFDCDLSRAIFRPFYDQSALIDHNVDNQTATAKPCLLDNTVIYAGHLDNAQFLNLDDVNGLQILSKEGTATDSGTESELASRTPIEGLEISLCDFQGLYVQGIHLKNLRWSSGTATGNFDSVLIDGHSRLSNLYIAGTSHKGAKTGAASSKGSSDPPPFRFKKVIFEGTEFKETYFEQGCVFDNCTFNNISCENSEFVKCAFRNCTFANCSSKGPKPIFRECRLESCTFDKITLRNQLDDYSRKNMKNTKRSSSM